MKFRFTAALLLAALSITLLTGCAAETAAPTQPILSAMEEPQLPLAPAPETVPPALSPASAVAPTEVPTAAKEATEVPIITKEEAIAIALADAGFTADQVTRLRTEFDYEGRRPEYEVDFHRGGYEYDYEIHAETGVILSKDVDRED